MQDTKGSVSSGTAQAVPSRYTKPHRAPSAAMARRWLAGYPTMHCTAASCRAAQGMPGGGASPRPWRAEVDARNLLGSPKKVGSVGVGLSREKNGSQDYWQGQHNVPLAPDPATCPRLTSTYNPRLVSQFPNSEKSCQKE